MTQRTHDLAVWALVSYRILSHSIRMNWETVLEVGITTVLEAAVPDIDNVTSPAW